MLGHATVSVYYKLPHAMYNVYGVSVMHDMQEERVSHRRYLACTWANRSGAPVAHCVHCLSTESSADKARHGWAVHEVK
jgi:hypothetical protein